MLQKILLITVIATVYCQYPDQRARHRPPPEEYAEDYDLPPRQAPPPQPAYPPNSRAAIVHKPASVHYVNIGLELAGDYKFGYDTGKGDGQSFREETRLPDGTVQGAYGYIDETGRQRIVKYTAGKDGFKVQGDVGPQDGPGRAPSQAAAPAQPAPAPQQAYRPPPPQPAYAPEPAPRPQPAYRAPAPAQPAYRPPPQPQPRPAYRAPPAPQPAYAPEPEYAPRPQTRARPAPRPVEETPDYDYPDNEIGERRLVPVDTTLFNYNIGTSQDRN